jgi:hypothetical protein
MENKHIHVIHECGGWSVKHDANSEDAVHHFPTMEEALLAGKILALENYAELLLHPKIAS